MRVFGMMRVMRASVVSWPAIPIIVFRMGRKMRAVVIRGTMHDEAGINCGKDLTCDDKRTGTPTITLAPSIRVLQTRVGIRQNGMV